MASFTFNSDHDHCLLEFYAFLITQPPTDCFPQMWLLTDTNLNSSTPDGLHHLLNSNDEMKVQFGLSTISTEIFWLNVYMKG